ncbi:hypothetical protein MicloDRAFT_00061480 [Microvirga lotononidis]|uniref:Uncharacterized protein n=1 Tax=Microvirga lotononidis TaxID=864069 RepID=I4YN80_9HYPH|nr:hypothetical protein MicloDRAFT_00061480 [Microvirga lotononidis]
MRMRILLALARDSTEASRTGIPASACAQQIPLPGSGSRALRAVPNIMPL